MIDKDIALVPGMIVRQDEGLTYRIDGVQVDTRDYEETHQLDGKAVSYTQLENGKMPAGTEYNKDEERFREYFTLVQEQA